MATTKNATATQVSAVTNSYMSPQGSRCTDTPRRTTPVAWAARPRQTSATATATHRPTPVRPLVTAGPTPAGPSPARPSPARPSPARTSPAGDPTDPPAAPTSAGTRAAAAAFTGFLPNAKSQAKASR